MSRKLKRANVGANSEPAIKPYLMIEGETRIVSIDFKAFAGIRGTSVSSAVWESDAGVTLSSPTLVSDTASVKFTAETPGIWPVKCVATLANGEKAAKVWRADVRPAKAAALLGEGGSGTQPDGPDAIFSGGEVEFEFATYVATAQAVLATIRVVRQGGAFGAASVVYATSDGTATEGEDYEESTGTLSWADADDAPKSFDIVILIPRDGGTVNLTLSNPVGVEIGDINPALLTILADSSVDIYDEPGVYEWEPDPLASIEVRIVGAGGGGAGGAVTAGSSGVTAGAGGGGGGAVIATYAPGVLSGPIAITVGAGGAGGNGVSSDAGTDGQPGGATSFGALIAGGGGGGYRGIRSAADARRSGGGGGGGTPNSGATGTEDGGAGGVVGGGAGGGSGEGASNGFAPSTDYGGGGGGAGGKATTYTGASSLWGGSGGGSGGTAIDGLSATPGANGTASTGVVTVPQGGAQTTGGPTIPILGPGDSGTNPADPLLLAGSSGAGGGASPSNVAGVNTGQGGAGGVGGRGSGGGGGGSSFSSEGLGGAGGTGGNGYVVIISTFE